MAAPGLTTETPEAFAARNLKWNLPVLLMEAGLFTFGLNVFAEGTIVFPVLMKLLGSPDWLVGLTRFVQTLGFAVPSLLAAHYIHGRARHKGFMVGTTVIGRTLIQTLWPALLWFGREHPRATLCYLIFVYSTFWIVDGFCAVSWTDIVAKAVPDRVRGRFFGLMQSLSGVLAICAGAIIAYCLDKQNFSYPTNYAILAALWAGSSITSFIFLISIREPEGIHVDKSEKPKFRYYLKGMVPLLRKYPRVRSIILLRWTLDGVGLASSFYVLYAIENLHVALVLTGAYSIVKNIGKAVTGPIWGHISDKHTPIATIRIIACCILAVPATALLARTTSPYLLFGLFFLMGTAEDGLWTTCQNLLYLSVEEKDRALAIGVVTTAQIPCASYSFIGGLIATFFGYYATFFCALAFGLAGLAVAIKLPRQTEPAA